MTRGEWVPDAGQMVPSLISVHTGDSSLDMDAFLDPTFECDVLSGYDYTYGYDYLVHLKDRIEDHKKIGVVYSIPCNNCEAKYIGGTRHCCVVQLEEHKKETENINTE